MILNKGQQIGLEKLLLWAEDDNPKNNVFTLVGAAGTGKTTLLKEFLKQYDGRVAITAPTHKAVAVASNILQKRGVTLHSLHGLRPNVNLITFNLNNKIFDPLGETKIDNYSLVIIDECSMINSSLFKLNKERAELFDVKILFVGDDFQLPPINENISMTFSAVDKDHKYELTEIMRQGEGNPLIDVYSLLRNDIDNGTKYGLNHMLKNMININKINDTKIGYAILERTDFNTKLLDDFPRIIKGIDIKYLTYTNEDALIINNYIRKNIIISNDIIAVGDKLTSHTTLYDEYLAPTVKNSMEYIVLTVDKVTSDYGFEMFNTQIQDIITKDIYIINIVNHADIKSWKTYQKLVAKFYDAAINANNKNRGMKWHEYFDFKKNYLQMIRFNIKKNIVEKDITYGYGSTIYKAQGETFDITYINLRSIYLKKSKLGEWQYDWRIKNRNELILRNKLAYVALSRTRTKAIMLWV